jgi:hypothetical protein
MFSVKSVEKYRITQSHFHEKKPIRYFLEDHCTESVFFDSFFSKKKNARLAGHTKYIFKLDLYPKAINIPNSPYFNAFYRRLSPTFRLFL